MVLQIIEIAEITEMYRWIWIGLLMLILALTAGGTPLLKVEVEFITEAERRELEGLKVAGAEEREIEWREVRDLLAEGAQYPLTMETEKVEIPLQFPLKPLGILRGLFRHYVNFVGVSINSQEPVLLLLDTGSPVTAFSPRSAIAHKLPILIEFKPKTGIKHLSVPAYLGRADIKVGQAEVKDAQVIVLQGNVEARLLGLPLWRFIGTLGFDFLARFSSCTIDYPKRVLILRHPNSEYELKEGALRLPLKVLKLRPIIEVYLNGKGPFPFLFDTGSSSANLLISPEVALELGFVGKITAVRLAQVRAGDLLLKDIKAEVLLFPKGQLFVGIFPRALFSSYRVTIDFKDNAIFLER